MSATLWIAAKAPRPGEVKTRLARTIGTEGAARVYVAFLRDLAVRFTGAPFTVGWYVTPGSWPELERVLGPAVAAGPVLEQRGDDWTERQRHLFRTVAGNGGGPSVLVASDSPQLERAVVLEAFRSLARHDVVLGPVRDGGYYLIGMRRWHDILAGVEMSTATACEEIDARARRLGLDVAHVESTFDIDEAADLALLRPLVQTRCDLANTASALAALDGRA
jgi:rSAM/selenodomain-associated transferase 1